MKPWRNWWICSLLTILCFKFIGDLFQSFKVALFCTSVNGYPTLLQCMNVLRMKTILIERICLRRSGSFDLNPEELYSNLMTEYDVLCFTNDTMPAQTHCHRYNNFIFVLLLFYRLMAIYFYHKIHFISIFLMIWKEPFIKNSIIS